MQRSVGSGGSDLQALALLVQSFMPAPLICVDFPPGALASRHSPKTSMFFLVNEDKTWVKYKRLKHRHLNLGPKFLQQLVTKAKLPNFVLSFSPKFSVATSLQFSTSFHLQVRHLQACRSSSSSLQIFSDKVTKSWTQLFYLGSVTFKNISRVIGTSHDLCVPWSQNSERSQRADKAAMWKGFAGKNSCATLDTF